VVLDFVGNHRSSYVARLALAGFHSVEEYREVASGVLAGELRQALAPPPGCFVEADLDVHRIWQSELEGMLPKLSVEERLKQLYTQMKEDLALESPKLMTSSPIRKGSIPRSSSSASRVVAHTSDVRGFASSGGAETPGHAG